MEAWSKEIYGETIKKDDILKEMNDIGEIQKNNTVSALAGNLPIYLVKFE